MMYLSCELRLDGNSKVSWDCCAKNLSIWRLSWAFRLFRSLSISSAVFGGLEAEVVLGLAKVLSFFELWKDDIEFYSSRVGLFMTHWAKKGRGLNWRALRSFFISFYTISQGLGPETEIKSAVLMIPGWRPIALIFKDKFHAFRTPDVEVWEKVLVLHGAPDLALSLDVFNQAFDGRVVGHRLSVAN